MKSLTPKRLTATTPNGRTRNFGGQAGRRSTAESVHAMLGIRRRGPQKTPTKQVVTIRLSPDVVEAFWASGTGWQTRVDAALRDWLKTHQPGLAGQLARKKRNMAQRAYNHAEYLAQRRKRILVLFWLGNAKSKSKKQKQKQKAAKSKTDAVFKVVLGTTSLQEFGRAVGGSKPTTSTMSTCASYEAAHENVHSLLIDETSR